MGIADETRIYLLRHAEFDTTDPEKMLSQEGRGRAAALADRFKDVKVDYVFSRIKRKLSARALGRSFSTQQRQALLLGLVFNFYRWVPTRAPPRMSTEPDGFQVNATA